MKILEKFELAPERKDLDWKGTRQERAKLLLALKPSRDSASPSSRRRLLHLGIWILAQRVDQLLTFLPWYGVRDLAAYACICSFPPLV